MTLVQSADIGGSGGGWYPCPPNQQIGAYPAQAAYNMNAAGAAAGYTTATYTARQPSIEYAPNGKLLAHAWFLYFMLVML